METKDIVELIEKQGKANAARLDTLQGQLDEAKKGTIDPLTKEKLGKITEDLASLVEIKARQDKIEVALKRRNAQGENDEVNTDRVEHRKAFDRFVRKGRDENLAELEKKALSVTSDPDGGYTAPVELDREITRIVTEISDIRSLVQVQTIGSPSLKKLITLTGTTSGWVGETESRPQTANAKLTSLEFPTMELYAMPAASQTLLDDSFVNIEEWAAQEVGIEFARAEGVAFVSGDGVKKPKGLLAGTMTLADGAGKAPWGETAYVKTGVNGAFKTTAPGDNARNLTTLVFSLMQQYRAGASFIMNRTTLGNVMGLTDDHGRPLWTPTMSLEAGVGSTLMGYPVNEIQGLPDMSDNDFAIGFGNWQRHYLIVDRVGVRVLRDPFTAKPHVLFYTTKRVGGGIQMYEAAKWLKFAA